MKLGEVGLLTNDVVRLVNFYKKLLRVDNNSNDNVHQTIISEETMLTIYNDESIKNNCNQNMCIAFLLIVLIKNIKELLNLELRLLKDLKHVHGEQKI